jgi:hypothetical protein
MSGGISRRRQGCVSISSSPARTAPPGSVGAKLLFVKNAASTPCLSLFGGKATAGVIGLVRRLVHGREPQSRTWCGLTHSVGALVRWCGTPRRERRGTGRDCGGAAANRRRLCRPRVPGFGFLPLGLFRALFRARSRSNGSWCRVALSVCRCSAIPARHARARGGRLCQREPQSPGSRAPELVFGLEAGQAGR